MTQAEDDELWAAAADPSRRRVLDALLRLGEATPTTLAKELPFTRQAVSKHLAILLRAGMVELACSKNAFVVEHDRESAGICPCPAHVIGRRHRERLGSHLNPILVNGDRDAGRRHVRAPF